MNYQNIIVEQDLTSCVISINRESKLNALNKETLDELHDSILNAIKDEAISGIILTGKGKKAFVAGADISEFAQYNAHQGQELAREGQNKVFNIISNSSKPIVAAINGYALGGGLELALACHLRIAADHAKLGLPEVSLGLIPGYGGTQRLTQLVGRGRALEIILTADMIDTQKAYEYGMVNHVVPLAGLLTKAKEILNKIGANSPEAVAAAIRAVNAAHPSDGYDIEINEFSKMFGTEEFKEGTDAFLEKRKPNFRQL